MLEAKSLSCVRDERILFSELSFSVQPGDIIQVEGPNGAGKTSLLRILAGSARPDGGEVCWRGRSTLRDRAGYQQDLLFIGHQPGIKAVLTPFENLQFYQAVRGTTDHPAIWRARAGGAGGLRGSAGGAAVRRAAAARGIGAAVAQRGAAVDPR